MATNTLPSIITTEYPPTVRHACYFGVPVEILSTCCDGVLTTIQRCDGQPFAARWSHGGWYEPRTITVRSYNVAVMS